MNPSQLSRINPVGKASPPLDREVGPVLLKKKGDSTSLGDKYRQGEFGLPSGTYVNLLPFILISRMFSYPGVFRAKGTAL